MIRGITFASQLVTSADFAHYINTFLAANVGRTKGIEINHDDENVFIGSGYFVTFGRYVNITGTETIATETVPTGTQYNRLVFTVDLTKENTETTFNQGYFELLTSYDDYASLVQEDLDAGGSIYQIPFCRFTKSLDGIDHFVEELNTVNIGVVFDQITTELAGMRAEYLEMFTKYRAEFIALVEDEETEIEEIKQSFEEFFEEKKLIIERMIQELQDRDFVTTETFDSEIDRVQFGFENKNTVFNDDGSITETTPEYTVTTVFNEDGSITTTKRDRLGYVKAKKTVFNPDGSISETLI